MFSAEKLAAAGTIEIKVLVRVWQADGTAYDGDFIGVFKKPEQGQIDEMIEDGWKNSEVLDEYLVSVKGIGRTATEPMPEDEALALVKKTPECVSAACVAFFQKFAPERYNAKTSRKRRGG